MKKIALIIMMIMLFLVGCSSPEESNVPVNTDTTKTRIGIIQLVEHPSLDAARQGFLDVLTENGYIEGENLVIDYKNAQNDMPTLNTIAQNLVSGENELILAIATPSAQALANATKNNKIPVLFTAVTDPVTAGLVKSLEKPETNLTGTIDMAPIKEQINLIKEISPDVKNVGVLYNTSEVNSVVQVDLVKEAAKDLGLNIVEAIATNSSEVDQAARSLVGKVDAIYIPTDNTVVSAVEAVVKVALENKLLVISAEKDSVVRGTVATIGLDYYELGRQTGEMALKILKEGSNPANMPVESQKEKSIIINVNAAEALGITIPETILEKAQEIIKIVGE